MDVVYLDYAKAFDSVFSGNITPDCLQSCLASIAELVWSLATYVITNQVYYMLVLEPN